MNVTLRRWRAALRTADGQLWLLAAAFLIAAGLSLIPWTLRTRIFEYYAKETYLPLDGKAESALALLQRVTPAEEALETTYKELKKKAPRTPMHEPEFLGLERLYGAWMEDEDTRRGGRLARRLTGEAPAWLREWTLSRLRMTLAAGNLSQREGAVAWIEAALDGAGDATPELRALLEYAHSRAARRGPDERPLAERAAAILAE